MRKTKAPYTKAHIFGIICSLFRVDASNVKIIQFETFIYISQYYHNFMFITTENYVYKHWNFHSIF